MNGEFLMFASCVDPIDIDLETRYYPEPLSGAALDELGPQQFVRYLREMLWDSLSTKRFACPFFSLTPEHKRKIDGMAVMEIAKAYDEIGIFERRDADG